MKSVVILSLVSKRKPFVFAIMMKDLCFFLNACIQKILFNYKKLLVFIDSRIASIIRIIKKTKSKKIFFHFIRPLEVFAVCLKCYFTGL